MTNGSTLDRPLAAAYVRYALALNTLNPDWLHGALSAFVTYESQSVFAKLSGAKVVLDHLARKFKAIARSADGAPRFDLAYMQGDVPCVAGFQPRGPFDTNWLRAPLTNVRLTVDALGLINSILIITVAPNPAAARCSGIFPGAETTATEQARRFIRSADDCRDLRFAFFLLDGKIGLDRQMQETATALPDIFPMPKCSVSIWRDGPGESAYRDFNRAQFSSFPSVAVFYADQILFRHQGLISTERLVQEIKQVTGMYIAAP